MSDESVWYYLIDGDEGQRQDGPVPAEELRTLLSDGKLPADALVWREGMSDWAQIGTLPEFSRPEPLENQAPESPQTEPQETESPEFSQTEPQETESPASSRTEPPEEALPEFILAGPLEAEPSESPQPEAQEAALPDAVPESVEPPRAEPAAVTRGPVGKPPTVTIKEFAGYSVEYSPSRGVLLIVTNDYHAEPLELTRLDLLGFLLAMESSAREPGC